MHPYRLAAAVVLAAWVALPTAMATMTLLEHWRAATALFSAAAVVVVAALLVAAGAALAAALAMPPWRTATPRHLPWYALLLQSLVQSHGQLMSGTLGSFVHTKSFSRWNSAVSLLFMPGSTWEAVVLELYCCADDARHPGPSYYATHSAKSSHTYMSVQGASLQHFVQNTLRSLLAVCASCVLVMHSLAAISAVYMFITEVMIIAQVLHKQPPFGCHVSVHH